MPDLSIFGEKSSSNSIFRQLFWTDYPYRNYYSRSGGKAITTLTQTSIKTPINIFQLPSKEIDMEYEDDDMEFELENIAEINSKILKANNELFLQTNRKFFGWRSDVLRKDLVNLTINNIDIRIPYGIFFYPCSGKDFKVPVSIFKNSVAEYHFSDPFKPIEKSIPRIAAPKLSDTIQIPDVGNVVVHNGASTTLNYEEFKIISHQKDGLLTFIDDIKSISIFYYRGDSPVEGGSGQFWFGPVLLDLILSKMINGGLICTDWSNSYGFLAKQLKALEAEEEFLYRDLVIKKISLNLPAKFDPMFVFQVTEIN